jgi:hypothetical protein
MACPTETLSDLEPRGKKALRMPAKASQAPGVRREAIMAAFATAWPRA